MIITTDPAGTQHDTLTSTLPESTKAYQPSRLFTNCSFIRSSSAAATATAAKAAAASDVGSGC